ncbi:MAG: hypothetical protein ACFFDT_36755 [Candidatus Hodarchaeota archaeon]
MIQKLANLKGSFFVMILFLLPMIIYPTIGSEEWNYDVDPGYYTLGSIEIGDTRTYIFEHIRFREDSTTPEIEKMNITVSIANVKKNITVIPGSKVTITVSKINTTYVTLNQYYKIFGESDIQTDPIYVNLSSLTLIDQDHNLRLIMTTNRSLIEEVLQNKPYGVEFQGDPMNPDSVNFHSEFENSHDDIGYNLSTGFLEYYQHYHEDSSGERLDIRLSETMIWNPDHYTLGINVGDSNTYVFSQISHWDQNQNQYFHDIPIKVIENGVPKEYFLHQGDKFTLEVIDSSGDYVVFKVTYQEKDGGTITDEKPLLLDISTGYTPRMFGPPLLMTTNTTLIGEIAPPEVIIADNAVTLHMEHTDPLIQWKSVEDGKWTFPTGWLESFRRVEEEYGQLRDKFEIIDEDLYIPPETVIKVKPGDSKVYKFKEILNTEEDGTTNTNFEMSLPVNNNMKTFTVQEGDKLTLEVTEVEGWMVTIVMTAHSSIDGDVVSDPFSFDLSVQGSSRDGPPAFIVPTDKQMIKDLFEGMATVTFNDGDNTATVSSSYTDGNMEHESEYIYDLETGWLIRVVQITREEGIELQKILVEAIEEEDNGGELTPAPILPVIISLIVLAGFVRKRH